MEASGLVLLALSLHAEKLGGTKTLEGEDREGEK